MKVNLHICSIENVMKSALRDTATIRLENVSKNVHKAKILLLILKLNFAFQFVLLDILLIINQELVSNLLIVQMTW